MSDVVAEAKTLESTQRTNQLIVDTSKSIEEQFHRANFKNRHSEMCLKREINTCHSCGSTQGHVHALDVVVMIILPECVWSQ